MGQPIAFGDGASGYLAVPASGSGPGVVVIQEWWGLNDQIEEFCDRLAGRGLVALAPDLYRGVETAEPDEAAKLMMALNMERAAADLSGAIDALLTGQQPSSNQKASIGCNIKWKVGNEPDYYMTPATRL